MALLGTYTDFRTLTLAATAAGGFAHGITSAGVSIAPDMVFVTHLYGTTDNFSTQPLVSAQWDSLSVSLFNQGRATATINVMTQRVHTIAR